ncbi:MAG: hypothetical protein JXQ93_04405 [Flavobacteriaceae bacterium]
MIKFIDSMMIAIAIINVLVLMIGLVFCLKKRILFILSLYITLILIVEILSLFEINSMTLFSLSYYIHIAFLISYFFEYHLKIGKKIILLLLIILLIPMIYVLNTNTGSYSYESYDRLFYSLCIVLLALIMLVRYYSQKLINSSYLVPFLLILLLYFSLDFVIALTTNYLINEHLSIVGWVWLFRVICISIFYIILILFSVNHTPSKIKT